MQFIKADNTFTWSDWAAFSWWYALRDCILITIIKIQSTEIKIIFKPTLQLQSSEIVHMAEGYVLTLFLQQGSRGSSSFP